MDGHHAGTNAVQPVCYSAGEAALAGTAGRNRSLSMESSRMPVDPELLDILACPDCKTKVELVKNGTAIKCGQCKRVYPIKDDIPVMLIDEATIEP
jgi:uncharacterized protein YbaR (Trm112 family)